MNVLDCLLIADDLTGACDSAVHFAVRGRRTAALVCLESEAPDADVIAWNTASRDLPLSKLRPLIEGAVRQMAFRDARILFKKIDSTLRGHPGAEIAAALEACECDAAVITPAYPAANRVVEGGFLSVTGAGDCPPIEVARRLRANGIDRCEPVCPCAVREALESGARFISVDASREDDLDRVVAEGLASGRRVLWAGSAGLAAALARTLDAAVPTPRPPRSHGPVLFCIGSEHPATIVQQERLLALRPEHPLLRVPWGRLAPERLREHLERAAPAALALSGGDTAWLVCRAIGAQFIELAGEIVPGAPYGVLRAGIFDGMPVATKSGGFGDPDALLRVADFFTCHQP